MQNPNKRVNVISVVPIQGENGVIPPGILMRTTRSYAAKLIEAGTHKTTSKGKLRSFLNKNFKLMRNAEVINKLDLKDKKAGHQVWTDEYNGKTYVAIKKKEVEVTMFNPKEIDPNTGKPREFKMMQPRFEIRVARFPVY